MLAGRPQEAVGNGSPRWMTVAPRKRGHRTRPTGRLTPFRLVFSAVLAKGALAWVARKNALLQGERKTCRLLRFK